MVPRAMFGSSPCLTGAATGSEGHSLSTRCNIVAIALAESLLVLYVTIMPHRICLRCLRRKHSCCKRQGFSLLPQQCEVSAILVFPVCMRAVSFHD